MATTEFDVEQTLVKLTMPQKIKLLAGLGWWHTQTIPEAGVPSMRMTDGPNGARGTHFFNGVPSNCFPSSTGLGSSFDIDLITKIGKALGNESRAKGCHILLAPTVNTQRSPLGGRGFESFSEDPHLNGTIAAAYINGLQSTGVAATIKHYVANDQEYQRFSVSSEVSERALREIYLRPFQIAIKDANPWALMTAYNRVNGIHASESTYLLRDILRSEWEYKGLVMSDWTGVYSTTEAIKAGLDLEMPGPTAVRGPAVSRALIGEKLFPDDIDACVRKILELLKRAYASGIPFDGAEGSIDTPGTRALLRTASAAAVVLLKNELNLLPLHPPTKKIAVIGPNAKLAMTSGGGSAALLSTYTVSPLQGITTAAKEIGAEVVYTIGAMTHKYLPLLSPYLSLANGQPGALLEFWNDSPSKAFLNVDANLNETLAEHVWSTSTNSSRCFLADGVDDTLVNEICFIRYSTKFTPDEDGDWELDLNLAGRGNFFFDGKLIIELSIDPPLGDSFFGMGTANISTVVKGLKAGKAHDLEIRINNDSFVERGAPFTCRGGIRLGGMRKWEPEQAIQEAVKLAKESDVAVVVVGLNLDLESEGFDREDMKLPGLTDRLIVEILRANPNTVIVNQTGTPVEMPWINEAKTVIQAFYGGNEVGNGLADVLFGKVNPSAKLALTFPERLEDNPSYPSFGSRGQEYGKVSYNEGIFVGYRNYEIKNITPLFPFGYGLSYTTFSYSAISVSPISPSGEFAVSFTVQNSGTIDGQEVVQVYITDRQASLPRPKKELKGFTKVVLKAGESKMTTICLDRYSLSFWDDQKKAWIAEKGMFEVLVAASSMDVRLRAEVQLMATFTWRGL